MLSDIRKRRPRSADDRQAWMNPHILIQAAQPNLLDIAGDGQRVMKLVFDASGHLPPW